MFLSLFFWVCFSFLVLAFLLFFFVCMFGFGVGFCRFFCVSMFGFGFLVSVCPFWECVFVFFFGGGEASFLLQLSGSKLGSNNMSHA